MPQADELAPGVVTVRLMVRSHCASESARRLSGSTSTSRTGSNSKNAIPLNKFGASRKKKRRNSSLNKTFSKIEMAKRAAKGGEGTSVNRQTTSEVAEKKRQRLSDTPSDASKTPVKPKNRQKIACSLSHAGLLEKVSSMTIAFLCGKQRARSVFCNDDGTADDTAMPSNNKHQCS